MQKEESSNLEYQTFKQSAGRKTDTYLRWNLLKRADNNSQLNKVLAKSSDELSHKSTEAFEEEALGAQTLVKDVEKNGVTDKDILEKSILNNNVLDAEENTYNKGSISSDKAKSGSIFDVLKSKREHSTSVCTPQNDVKDTSANSNEQIQHINFSLRSQKIHSQQTSSALKQRVQALKEKEEKKLSEPNTEVVDDTRDEIDAEDKAKSDLNNEVNASVSCNKSATPATYNIFNTLQQKNSALIIPKAQASVSSVNEILSKKNSQKPTIVKSVSKHIDFSLQAKQLQAKQRSLELKKSAHALKNNTKISDLLDPKGSGSSSLNNNIYKKLQAKSNVAAIQDMPIIAKPRPEMSSSNASIADILKGDKQAKRLTISKHEAEHISFSLLNKAKESAQRSQELRRNTQSTSSPSSIMRALANTNDFAQSTSKPLVQNTQDTNVNCNSFKANLNLQHGDFSSLFTCKQNSTSIQNEDSLQNIFHRIESCQ